jgi:hypothetical protein
VYNCTNIIFSHHYPKGVRHPSGFMAVRSWREEEEEEEEEEERYD